MIVFDREATPFGLIPIVLGCVLLGCFIACRKQVPRGLRLPPGPRGNFISGNAADIPTHHQWETFTRWGKEFGDLVSVKVFGQHMIIVNSIDVAYDLFEKRSALYSDRISLVLLNDLMGFDWSLGMMRYGDRWRRHRKMFHQSTNANAATAYHQIQTKHTRALLLKLHDSPDAFLRHLQFFSGALIIEIVYGINQPDGAHYMDLAERAVAALTEAAQPGAFLVDTLPFLKYIPEWMPGAGFQKKARLWRKPITEMCVAPFEVVKGALSAGTAQSSLTSSLLEDLSHRTDAPADEEEVIRNVASVTYLAGADTTSTTLAWFFLAMALYPEVLRKAQAELDSVIGTDRLPEFADCENLPYINALHKEVHRWNPVSPLGLGHRVMADDVYGDYFIPKGSLVIGNAWNMLHDVNVYGPAPETFQPERFLKPGVPDPEPAWGFGRRICPGRFLADNAIFIAIASVLAVFDISPAKDTDGNPVPIKIVPTSGAVSHPEPFQCAIRPRSAAAERLLLQYSIDI